MPIKSIVDPRTGKVFFENFNFDYKKNADHTKIIKFPSDTDVPPPLQYMPFFSHRNLAWYCRADTFISSLTG